MFFIFLSIDIICLFVLLCNGFFNELIVVIIFEYIFDNEDIV